MMKKNKKEIEIKRINPAFSGMENAGFLGREYIAFDISCCYNNAEIMGGKEAEK